MSHFDYAALIKKGRIRRGECPECGASEAKGACDCTDQSSKTASSLPREIRRTKMIPQIELICPCCKEEIREKGTALDGEEDGHPVWRHRACGGRFRGTEQAEREVRKLFSKHAAVDPDIRSSADDSAANGNDVQQPLLRNPYEPNDPQNAQAFENGYQFAQGLGHQQLNQSGQDHLQAWAARPPAWRAGFAQAALGMGCGTIANQLDPSAKIATITHEVLVMLPLFPLTCNLKIAGALGTLAGGLGGALLGGAAGGLHSIGEGMSDPSAMDVINSHHGGPGEPQLSPEEVQAMLPTTLKMMTETGGGAALGGTAGALLGNQLTKSPDQQMSPNQSMGEHKMASFRALEYFKVSGNLGFLAGGLTGIGLGGAAGGAIGDNYNWEHSTPSDASFDHTVGTGLGAAVGGTAGAALGDAVTNRPMGRQPIIKMGPDGKPQVVGFRN